MFREGHDFLTQNDEREMLIAIESSIPTENCSTNYYQEGESIVSASSRTNRGKPKSKLRKISECFATHLGSTNALKKDNLRTRILRRLKRILRITGKKERRLSQPHISSAFRKHLGIKRNNGSPELRAAVQRWTDVLYLHQSDILPWGKTNHGPTSDQKGPNQSSELGKSYSNTFCQKFFNTPGMRELYSAFIDAIVADKTCRERSKALKTGNHLCDVSWECEEIWANLVVELKLFAS